MELGDRADHVGPVRTPELDVVAGTDCTLEVAERPAEEAGAEVEAEDERRLRHRLEVDGAVARPVGIRLRLAHELVLEQGLEGDRDRRLRDPGSARDLGARDRRTGPDRLEDGLLVQVLEQGRGRGPGRQGGKGS